VEGDVDTRVTEKSQTALALASMVSGSYFSMLGARARTPVLSVGSRERASRLRMRQPRFGLNATPTDHQSDFARLAGGTIPFMRKYSTICP
jgi:hypothetical protein